MIFGSALLIIALASGGSVSINVKYSKIIALFQKSGLDINSSYDRQIFEDGVSNVLKENPAEKAELITSINKFTEEKYTNKELKTGNRKETLSFSTLPGILWKFLKFLFLFFLVEISIFYFSERLALIKFYLVKEKKNSFVGKIYQTIRERKDFYVKEKLDWLKIFLLLIGMLVRFVGYLVLFSPVYVIAYVLKFNSENFTFIWGILFGIFTNGVLIAGVNKFYHLLITESKRGYVETAMVKNVPLFPKAEWRKLLKILLLKKGDFGETIVTQIFASAHLQFVPSFKEVSRFVITGLIIIGMALNIQSGVFYQMLRSFLFAEYDILFFILFLIFTTVKFVDTAIDLYAVRESGKYEN
jgi:hypothetical protein